MAATREVSKELKSLLKSARSALDKEDHREAIKQCQAVFWLDESHYLAHVLCGKAHLLLKEVEEARNHYRKAITSNEKELLAWKGLADLYDKYAPSDRGERLEAIDTYHHILDTVSGDGVKEFNLYCKLAPLYDSVRHFEKAATAYVYLLVSQSATDSIIEGSLLFLLGHPQYSRTQWQLIKGSYESYLVSLSETRRREIQKLFIDCCMEWIKLLGEGEGLEDLLKTVHEECKVLERKETQEALLQLEIWKCLKVVSIRSLTEDDLVSLLQLLSDRGEVEGEEEGVWLIACCLVLFQSRKFKEACTLADRGIALFPKSCDNRFVSCVCHMRSHDYDITIDTARRGLEILESLPVFIKPHVTHSFNLLLIEALLLEGSHGNVQEALSLSEKLYNGESCDYHVIRLYVKGLIASGLIDKANEIISNKVTTLTDNGILNELQGQVLLARGDLDQALDRFTNAVSECPDCSEYYYWVGYCNWFNGDKAKAYPPLVKAGQLDSYNPHVFKLLGDYQRYVANDTNRAVKCYQKAFTIHPGLTEAGVSLGECLSALGEEESAYAVYLKITEKSPPTQAKEAWLRIGLYHRRRGSYDEAIKCYFKVLHQNVSDSNVWECLGEAYLSRGSNIAAMKAFERASELNPQSIFSQYQVATIQQLIGQLSESVVSYTRVLELENDYVPALKGRAESYYKLSLEALKNVLDSKAVSYISLALIDLSNAVKVKPSFVSLWKLIGDSCISLYGIADIVARLSVPSELLGNDKGTGTIGKKELLELGLRSYKCGLHLCEGKSPHLLHNLSLNYYHLSKVEESDVTAKDYLELSLKLIKKAISLSPRGHTHWNALGVIAMHPILKQYALSQHAFIKSLQIEPNNAVVWTNLGTLYLLNDNIKLAHLAFERSQSCDPVYSQGWIGDGLVAEIIGKEDETRNFFQIVSEHQYHDESALGYAYWILSDTISSSSSSSSSLKVHEKLVQARDGILKYVRRYPQHSLALNLLGLLYEHEGLMKPAEDLLRQALSRVGEGKEKESENVHLPLVLHNHARLLSCIGHHSEALASYESLVAMETLDFELGHALALFRAKKFTEAKKVYQSLLDSCDSDIKSQVLLALSMCSFALNDNDSCKNLLFKVFQTPPPSLHGLLSLAIFAGYTGDPVLLQATLAELLKLTETTSCSLSGSCVFALHSLSSLCDEDKEVLEVFDKIVNCYRNDNINQQPHMSSLLRSLFEQSLLESLRSLQKVVHTHPGYLWAWPMIPYIMIVMGGKSPALISSYLQLVHSKAEGYGGREEKDAQSLMVWCKLLSNFVSE